MSILQPLLNTLSSRFPLAASIAIFLLTASWMVPSLERATAPGERTGPAARCGEYSGRTPKQSENSQEIPY